ncbi:MAG: ASPIC/UnbV domain-containing protein [Candidatus Acidiferrales bacterium]
MILTFGLGSHLQADSLEVKWPSGQIDKLAKIGSDQIITIREGQGLAASRPLNKRVAR